WKGDTLPAWPKRLSYMKSKGAGNKAHLQPVTHFLVHIGTDIARVVFQPAGTKFRSVTLVVLQDRAHGGSVAVCRCGNDRERQQIFRLPNGIHHLLFPPNTVRFSQARISCAGKPSCVQHSAVRQFPRRSYPRSRTKG